MDPLVKATRTFRHVPDGTVWHGEPPDSDAFGRCRYCGAPISSTAATCPLRGVDPGVSPLGMRPL